MKHIEKAAETVNGTTQVPSGSNVVVNDATVIDPVPNTNLVQDNDVTYLNLELLGFDTTVEVDTKTRSGRVSKKTKLFQS